MTFINVELVRDKRLSSLEILNGLDLNDLYIE